MGYIGVNLMAMYLIAMAAIRWPWEVQWPRYLLWALLGVLSAGEVVLYCQLPPREPGMYGR